MWAAKWLIEHGGSLPAGLSSARRVLPLGTIAYLAGLSFSIFLPTTVISNLAVTAGLSLLFLAAWHGLRSISPRTVGRLSWIGAHSYGAYLIHQPFLKWAVQLSVPYGIGLGFCVALVVLAVSLPVGAWLERSSAQILHWLSNAGRARSRAGIAIAVALLAALLVVDPLLQPAFGRARAAFQILLVAGFLSLIGIELAAWGRRPERSASVRWWAIAATFVSLWIAPPGEACLAVAAALVAALSSWIGLRHRSTASGLAAGFGAVALLATLS